MKKQMVRRMQSYKLDEAVIEILAVHAEELSGIYQRRISRSDIISMLIYHSDWKKLKKYFKNNV